MLTNLFSLYEYKLFKRRRTGAESSIDTYFVGSLEGGHSHVRKEDDQRRGVPLIAVLLWLRIVEVHWRVRHPNISAVPNDQVLIF